MDNQDQDLGEILKSHLKNVDALRYGDSNTAELLYQRTKMFSNKFFRMAYSSDLVGLKFRVQFSSIEDLNTIWHQNVPKLYAIAKTMYDDYSLNSSHKAQVIPKSEVKYVKVESGEKISTLESQVNHLQSKLDLFELRKKRLKKNFLFWGILIFSSAILWTFNSFIHWQWLEQHPKKVGIYLGFQFLIALLSIRIMKKDKAIDIATIITVIGIIISLL